MNFSSSSSCSKYHSNITLTTQITYHSAILDNPPKALHNQTYIESYPLHVLLNNIGKISAGLVVAIEGTLKSPLIQEIHRMSFEGIIFAWHSNKYSNTPTLINNNRSRFSFCLSKIYNFLSNK